MEGRQLPSLSSLGSETGSGSGISDFSTYNANTSAVHTVIIEVLEGRHIRFSNKQRSASPWVLIQFGNVVWKTKPQKKTSAPKWREYFIGSFEGTRLESPVVDVTVKDARNRSQIFGALKINLVATSEDRPTDKWHELSLGTPCPQIRLRIHCRRAYDVRSEIEEELRMINDIIYEEERSIASNEKKMRKLKEESNSKLKLSSGQNAKRKKKLKTLYTRTTQLHKKVAQLEKRKRRLVKEGKKAKLELTESEINVRTPRGRTKKSMGELQERLGSTIEKLRREAQALDFASAYTDDVLVALDDDAADERAKCKSRRRREKQMEMSKRVDYLRRKEKELRRALREYQEKESMHLLIENRSNDEPQHNNKGGGKGEHTKEDNKENEGADDEDDSHLRAGSHVNYG